MPKLYVLCGIPGSGKSTYTKTHLKGRYISIDDIRYQFLGDNDDYFVHENEVYSTFVWDIQRALNSDEDVIADATHLNSASRRKLLSRLNLDGVEVIAINFRVPLKTCLERNRTHTGRACVPEETICLMSKRFRPADMGEYKWADIIDVRG